MDVFPFVSAFPLEKHTTLQVFLAVENLHISVHVSGDSPRNQSLCADCAHKIEK